MTESDQAAAPESNRLLRLFVPSTAVLVFLAVFVGLAVSKDAHFLSFDVYLHMFMGRTMIEQGAVVATDPSMYPGADKPYLDHEWLPQIGMGLIERTFGLEGIRLLMALMVAVVFGLLATWMGRRGVGPLAVAIVLGLAFWVVYLFMLGRPFLVTWVIAVLWTWMLERVVGGTLKPFHWVLLATPLMMLWANAHAGFMLGFVLLGIFGLAQFWYLIRSSDDTRRLALRRFLWMVGAAEVFLFASMLNRYGVKLHGHMIAYLANPRLFNQIKEWQAPPFHDSYYLSSALVIGVFLFACVAAPRRLRAHEVLLVVALLLSALKSRRNLPFFFFLTAPIVGVQMQAILVHLAGEDTWHGRLIGRVQRLSTALAFRERARGGWLTVGLVVAMAILTLGVWKLRPTTTDANRYPEAALAFIAEHPELFEGRMFNRYRWGGYLAYELAPERQTFINGLQDHYGAKHHGDYQRVTSLGSGWEDVLDRHAIDWVMYSPRTSLARALEVHPGWRKVYGDRVADLFVRGTDRSRSATASSADRQQPSALASTAGSPPANVVVLVLDTTRADALIDEAAVPGDPSIPGAASRRARTPTLDRLAAEGTVFSHARTTSAWTVPSHGSLFTGRLPSQHGAHGEHQVLATEEVTLAEVLATTHQTAGFSENPHIGRRKGYAQGFHSFEETWRMGGDDIRPYETLDRVDSWLDGRDLERPFFLFINLMTPHLPYRPSDQQAAAYLPERATPELVARLRDFGEREAREYIAGEHPLSDLELATLRALYLGDVTRADEQTARLLGMLTDQGIRERTMIVVVGDHGENIGDHGLMEHQLTLAESLLRVPLIVWLPGVVEGGRVVDAPVQLTDVLPTVVEATIGRRTMWPPVAGVSLLGDPPPSDRPIVAEYMRPVDQEALFADAVPAFDFAPFDRRLRSIQVGALKLVVANDGSAVLHDLLADPHERHDLATSRPDDVAVLRERLESMVGDWPADDEGKDAAVEVDAETREALRSLGYAQ